MLLHKLLKGTEMTTPRTVKRTSLKQLAMVAAIALAAVLALAQVATPSPDASQVGAILSDGEVTEQEYFDAVDDTANCIVDSGAESVSYWSSPVSGRVGFTVDHGSVQDTTPEAAEADVQSCIDANLVPVADVRTARRSGDSDFMSPSEFAAAIDSCLIDAGAAPLERFRSEASEIGVDDLAARDACERSAGQARERFVGSSS